MRTNFIDYCLSLWNDLPFFVLIIFILLCIGSFFFIRFEGLKKGLKISSLLILCGYILILYCSTVFYRGYILNYGYNVMPFWSYYAYLRGENDILLIENLMNVVVFIPVGMLLGLMVNGERCMVKRGWKVALIVGLGLSVGIEVLQFVFKKGFSEVDDVMHNTIGCLIGYGFYRLLTGVYNYCYGCARIK